MTNEGLSAYELARLNRIKKNEAYLESIGLGSARQKMKEICKKTKKNVQRSQRVVVNPSQRRKSSRLSRNTMKDKHVQLSYYDDNEETVIEQDEEEAFVEYYDEAPARSRSKRYTTINRSDFELSSEEKQALGRSIDENYLYKFKVRSLSMIRNKFCGLYFGLLTFYIYSCHRCVGVLGLSQQN
jgi:hypothetical protein